MTAIRTNYMRIHLASQFLESLTEAELNNYYMFLGKVSDWSTEPVAEVPVSSFDNDDHIHWNDMIGGEKIPSSSVSHTVRRKDWVTGTVYVQYDDQDTALFSKDFYVLTDESNVYKCIDNNGGGASTIKPTGQATTILNTADGYRWKFMYDISAPDATKFLIAAWMPVKFLAADNGSPQWDVQQAAVDGSFDRIQITNGGSGYTTATATINGDGTGATATVVLSGGIITEINITAPGSGYSFAEVVITGDGVDGAARVVHAPAGGHGANPVIELGSFYIFITVKFEQDETGTLPTTNDFRKVGILKDPLDFGTTNLATLSNYNQTTAIQLDIGFTGTFAVDEILTGVTSGATATVVRFDSVNRIVYVNERALTEFVDAETVNSASGSGVVSTSGVSDPDLQPASGQILYIDQRASVSRAVDQTETIKTIFEF